MEKVKKYEITFDNVDGRINIEGVENYRYIKSHYLIADTKEKAISYIKSLIEEIKSLHLTNYNGEEFTRMHNGYTHNNDDYEGENAMGKLWLTLTTEPTKDKLGFSRWNTAIEIMVSPIEVTFI